MPKFFSILFNILFKGDIKFDNFLGSNFLSEALSNSSNNSSKS